MSLPGIIKCLEEKGLIWMGWIVEEVAVLANTLAAADDDGNLF